MQKPGCPDDTILNLSKERLNYLCSGECYNPDDKRHAIERIEIIKITPQEYRGEPIDGLILDAWKSFDCPKNNGHCELTFTDEGYTRDSIYYARAIQAETKSINGKQIQVEKIDGKKAKICKGSYLTDINDDCLFDANERAWSSPIFVNKP